MRGDIDTSRSRFAALAPRAAAVGLACALASSCAAPSTQSGSAGYAASTRPARPVYLVDRYGERFDITHAVANYGMHRRGFEFGIGKSTIRPLNQPRMLMADDPGYPDTGSAWGRGPDVIGAVIEGEARSYPVRPLTRHEIVNESVGQTVAAVAY